MNVDTPPCPHCTSKHTVKNGHIHNGKQNHKCKSCGRQFVENPRNKIIGQETKELIDKLLLRTLPLAGIARVAEVSELWLQGYVNHKYEAVPKCVESKPKKGDALASKAMRSGRLQGPRNAKSGSGWRWTPQPGRSLGCLSAVEENLELKGSGVHCPVSIDNVLSSTPTSGRHAPRCFRANAIKLSARAAAKRTTSNASTAPLDSGQARKVPLCPRQRVSRLVRSTLSFSKKLENFVGAIWTFVHHYNASLQL